MVTQMDQDTTDDLLGFVRAEPRIAVDDDETSGLPGPAMAAALAVGLVAAAAGAASILFGLFQWGVQ